MSPSNDVERIDQPVELPRRDREGHKGNYGRILIIGGSRGMIGATAFASNAAFRGGAGLVTFATPAPIQPYVATLAPCATSVALSASNEGAIAANACAEVVEAAEPMTALAIGPGFGVGNPQQQIIRAMLEQQRPLVIDADGLNNLAQIDQWNALRKCPLILTPHPGEFARLTGAPIKDIQSDRESAAVKAVRDWMHDSDCDAPLTLVLKGAGTVVTDGERMYVNRTGNPGMAAGGTGDVLTGLIAGLLGQPLDTFDAACVGVHAHGSAGDIAAQETGELSLTAADLLEYLPQAMKAEVE